MRDVKLTGKHQRTVFEWKEWRCVEHSKHTCTLSWAGARVHWPLTSSPPYTRGATSYTSTTSVISRTMMLAGLHRNFMAASPWLSRKTLQWNIFKSINKTFLHWLLMLLIVFFLSFPEVILFPLPVDPSLLLFAIGVLNHLKIKLVFLFPPPSN